MHYMVVEHKQQFKKNTPYIWRAAEKQKTSVKTNHCDKRRCIHIGWKCQIEINSVFSKKLFCAAAHFNSKRSIFVRIFEIPTCFAWATFNS